VAQQLLLHLYVGVQASQNRRLRMPKCVPPDFSYAGSHCRWFNVPLQNVSARSRLPNGIGADPVLQSGIGALIAKLQNTLGKRASTGSAFCEASVFVSADLLLTTPRRIRTLRLSQYEMALHCRPTTSRARSPRQAATSTIVRSGSTGCSSTSLMSRPVRIRGIVRRPRLCRTSAMGLRSLKFQRSAYPERM
jgi:hypothetical protein